MNKITIFREETTSALLDFHEGPLSRSNLNLKMLVFVEGGKLENPEKNPQSKARTNNKLNSTYIWHQAGIEPWPHWWETSTALITLLPNNKIASLCSVIYLLQRSFVSFFSLQGM